MALDWIVVSIVLAFVAALCWVSRPKPVTCYDVRICVRDDNEPGMTVLNRVRGVSKDDMIRTLRHLGVTHRMSQVLHRGRPSRMPISIEFIESINIRMTFKFYELEVTNFHCKHYFCTITPLKGKRR